MPKRPRLRLKTAQTSPDKRKSLRKPASSSKDDEVVNAKDVKDNIKEISTDIKKFWIHLQKKRFKTIPTSKGPYKSDRWIWQGVILLTFLWLWFIAQSYDYNMDYFRCGEGNRMYEGAHQTCENPFYKPGNAWKSMAELPYGEYGHKPGPLFNSAGTVVVGFFILALVLNHFGHNRRYRL